MRKKPPILISFSSPMDMELPPYNKSRAHLLKRVVYIAYKARFIIGPLLTQAQIREAEEYKFPELWR